MQKFYRVIMRGRRKKCLRFVSCIRIGKNVILHKRLEPSDEHGTGDREIDCKVFTKV